MSLLPTFAPDYPGSIVVPADASNVMADRETGTIKPTNAPRVLVLHTPEEPADNVEVTPRYFQTPNLSASTHYYADSDGDWYQMVPEKYGAIANGVRGKPWPKDTNPAVSLNYQSLSVEIEGYAASIRQTCVRGGPQWQAVVRWVEDRTWKYGIPLDRFHVIGHYEVADNRTDPGGLDIFTIVQDAMALRQTPQEDKVISLIKATNANYTYATDSIHKWHIPNPTVLAELQAQGILPTEVKVLSPEAVKAIPTLER